MTFVQTEFVTFFVIVYTLYLLLRRYRWQNLMLIPASMIFYGWVHPWFLYLLFASSILDYFAAIGMERYPHKKGLLLAASLTGNLGMLAYFKYTDFALANLGALLTTLGFPTEFTPLHLMLPVGISFYTFQTIGYTIDVYRGEMHARKNYLDYILFVLYFPHLVAGPVNRSSDLLVQIENPREVTWDKFRSGLSLALWGAVKKVVVADTVAPYVDKCFLLKEPNAAIIWAATLGFTVQILADFSGYTDIARGISRMMGIELVKNFDNPYIATNPSDFWRRWHISFSTWIRDYVYISLGGSRGGFWKGVAATYGAMLTSGFWHGASWTFVLWGAYHATLITGYRLVTPKIPKVLKQMPGSRLLAISIMFGFTVVGWLIFRETRIDRLISYFMLDPFGGTEDQFIAASVMFAVALVSSVPLFFGLFWDKLVEPRLGKSPWYLPLQTTGWATAVVLIFVFVRLSTTDFIYFQF